MAAATVSRNAQTPLARYEPVLVGRTRELSELWELAVKGRHVIVSGDPGVGKTTLLEMLYAGLKATGDLPAFLLTETRQFKSALVEMTAQMHQARIFVHPHIPENRLKNLPWEKLAPKVRALTVKQLAEALVESLKGRRAILIWDQFETATPTQAAWIHHFLSAATLIVATSNPDSAKLRPVLDRIPARIQLEPLSDEETDELIEACFEAAPFAISNVAWYKREIRRKTQGNPRAIKDLLADHSLEKYIDNQAIRAIRSEQAARYFPISWFALVGALLFSIHRYVGRGLGDRDAYIIGAVGMIVFIFLSILVRKANRTP